MEAYSIWLENINMTGKYKATNTINRTKSVNNVLFLTSKATKAITFLWLHKLYLQ